MEHKGAICVLRKDIILIRTSEGTIKVVLKRESNSLNAANTMEIICRGASPLRLMFTTIRTVIHHLHCFAPNLELLWSAVCPSCLLSSRKQHCTFPMKIEQKKMMKAKSESKKQTSGLDMSSCCERCARTELCLERYDTYMHIGAPNFALFASQLVDGMLVSDNKSKQGNNLQC